MAGEAKSPCFACIANEAICVKVRINISYQYTDVAYLRIGHKTSTAALPQVYRWRSSGLFVRLVLSPPSHPHSGNIPSLFSELGVLVGRSFRTDGYARLSVLSVYRVWAGEGAENTVNRRRGIDGQTYSQARWNNLGRYAAWVITKVDGVKGTL
jgi:hypothetical protein